MFKFLEENRKILVYIPFIIYWIILIIATSLPADQVPSVGISDKINHYLAYLVFSFLLNLTLMLQTKIPFLKKNSTALTIILGALYGIADEFHQMLIPGRSAEFYDWIADMLGIITGVIILYILKKFFSHFYIRN